MSNKLSNDYYITTKQPNEAEKKYTNIYIVGYGSTPFNIFFDNLSEQLKQELIKAGANCNYKFFGVSSKTLEKDIKKEGITNYDAIILLTQANAAGINQEVYYDPYYGYAAKSVKVKTDLNIEIVEMKDLHDSIVWGQLFADVNVRQTKIYLRISRAVIDFFKTNKVLLGNTN
jgi:hypothetical protein